MKNKKTKQRQEFKAWEKLVVTQIQSYEVSLMCLEAEIDATNALVSAIKDTLRKARQVEAAFKK